MADLGFGGRVLAGEDSEEDEEEEELGFQFGGFTAQPAAPVAIQPVVQPKFTVQTPVASNEESESEEEKYGDDDEEKQDDAGESAPASRVERGGRVSVDSTVRAISRPGTPEMPLSQQAIVERRKVEQDAATWIADGNVDGAAMVGNAIVQKLQPSLDATIRRIAELTDSQERLLNLMSSQHNDVCSNVEIENIAIVMGKLPLYIKKVQDMKMAMVDISSSVERMKKRSESLRVDAQSHALKRENKRESLSQWNKLYAAKSYEGATMSAAISSSFSQQQPPPS